MTIEEVRRADQRRRFHELGRVLFADEPRWAPVLRSYESWLFERRHPYHQRPGVEVARFLARRGGEVVGRICAHHVEGSKTGWFGAFECAEDAAAVAALVDAAGEWVAERGAVRLAGPATFTLADEAGVLVDGFEHAGATARPWHPPWYQAHLTAAGFTPDATGSLPRWRLATVPGPVELHPDDLVPPHAGRLGDRRLALVGDAGAIAAVPNISGSLRATSLRAARRAAAAPTEAAVVRLEGDPAALVPALRGAAHAAGYTHVWSPWSPDAEATGSPDTVHQVLTRPLP